MEGITSPPMSSGSSGSAFNPLLISMLGIAVTSLAIIFYHFFLVKYCFKRNQNTPTTTPTEAPSVPPPPIFTGVHQKILDTVPIFIFSELAKPNSQDECAVCLGELEDGDKVRILPNCKHAFHLLCIDQWFLGHASCPLCRSPIAPLKLPKSECSINDNNPDGENLVSAIGNFNVRTSDRRHQSLTLDLSVIVVDIQRENGSSAVEVTARGSQSARSLSRLDRMSSRLLRSFTMLRLGSTNSSRVLPY